MIVNPVAELIRRLGISAHCRDKRERRVGLPKALIAAFALVVTLVMASGCAGQRVETYPTLTGRFAPEEELDPLIAEVGQLHASAFRIVFRYKDERYEGGGSLDGLRLDEDADIVGNGPVLLPLEYWRHADQEPMASEGLPARVLDIADWHTVRDRLFASLIPVGTGEGIVVHFGVDDYFLYYDENGVFSVSVIDEKPGDYQIAGRYTFADVVAHGRPVLEEFLDDEGVDESLILMNTGDTGAYSLPFLFVDRNSTFAAFVRLGSASRDYIGAGSGDAVLQTAGHVVSSHTLQMISRPVSSAVRLLFMATDTVSETLRVQPTGPFHLPMAYCTPLKRYPFVSDWPLLALRASRLVSNV